MTVGQVERRTQNRVVNFFQSEMDYDYLGNWENRKNNSNIEKELLIKFFKEKRYNDVLIEKAIKQLEKTTTNQNRNLYDINKDVYDMLKHGIKVRESVGTNKKTVCLIDWKEPKKNHFYIAEEVTIKGKRDKRPDIVLYVNGIAIAVLELKRSTVSVSEGIRQNIINQDEKFIKNFFATIQLILAGNDTEGLRYGVIKTQEKYFLSWKESNQIQNRLDKHLYAICEKNRLLELIYDFIVFDRGAKKICRHNQYFGVKAAQNNIKKREGGIIWHTQGSGKSFIMICLAKWIRANIDDSRVLIITDRIELNEQIKEFFIRSGEEIYKTSSGKDLIDRLNEFKPWLLCSLVHKFKNKYETDYDGYWNEVFSSIPANFKLKGDLYVFVDECHRTQSGKLHKAMKEILPNSIFIGFTGTPLLKNDKKRSIEVFGKYIHTYKYDEAVKDKMVLDLQYEARHIEQNITAPKKIDQWFEAKTQGLTDHAKMRLKRRWGTLQKVLSSKSRLNKIVGDILIDVATKNRLVDGTGNAILVAGSIYEACMYYKLFQEYGLQQSAIITSYILNDNSIEDETVNDNEKTENSFKHDIYKKMLNGRDQDEFEREIKRKFVEEPNQIKLLIVVDKLLTGFDAPPATYLYIDKNMRDHSLFQAICRVNRLDGENKDYGFIIDYKDLFNSLGKAIVDYTSGAFDSYEPKDIEKLLKDRIKNTKEKLNYTLESIRELCEPVKPPKETINYIKYFCGDVEKSEDLQNTAKLRINLYKTVSSLITTYANLANDMKEAGYNQYEANKIKKEVAHYADVKKEIGLASGDGKDLKIYEPAMRYLLDSYVEAKNSVSIFETNNIVDLIVANGIDVVINQLPKNVSSSKKVVAAVIGNNIRRVITEERLTNPKYYEKMSKLLDEIIRLEKSNSIKYKKYLERISQLCNDVRNPGQLYPIGIDTRTKRALYDYLDQNEELAKKLDHAIIENKPDDWKGNTIKERIVMGIIEDVLKVHIPNDQIEQIFKLVKNQDDY